MSRVLVLTAAEYRSRRKLMALLAHRGSSKPDIGNLFGVSQWQVYEACREHRVTGKRGPRPLSFSTYDILARLFDPGASFKAIARERSMSFQMVQQVYQQARAAGIPLPERPNRKT